VIHRYYAFDAMNRQVLVDAEIDPGLAALYQNGGPVSNAQLHEHLANSGALGSAGKGHIIHYDQNGNRVSDTFLGRGVYQTPEDYLVGYEPGEYGGPIYGMRPRYVGFEATATDSYQYDAFGRLSTVVRGIADADTGNDWLVERRQLDAVGRVLRSGLGGVGETAGTLIDQGGGNNWYVPGSWYQPNGKIIWRNANSVAPLVYGYSQVRISTSALNVLNQGLPEELKYSAEARLMRYDVDGRTTATWNFKSDGATLSSYIANVFDTAGNLTNYSVDVRNGGGNADHTLFYKTTFKRLAGYKEDSISATGNRSYLQPGGNTFEYDANGQLKKLTDHKAHGGTAVREFVANAQGQIIETRQGDSTLHALIANGEVIGRYGKAMTAWDPYNGNAQIKPVVDFDFNYQPINPQYPASAPGGYSVQRGDNLQAIAQAVWGDSSLWYLIAEANGLTGAENLQAGQSLSIPNKVTYIHNNTSTTRAYNPTEMIGDTTPYMPSPPPPKKGCGVIGQIVMIIVAIVVAWIAAPLLAFLGPYLGPAMAAAAGSIASQGVGMAMGVVDKFSWKQVGLAAVTAGITAGVGGGFDKLGAELAGKVGLSGGLQTFAGRFLGGMATTGLTQLAQGKFNWRGVVAGGLANAAGKAVGGMFKGDTAASVFTQRVSTALVRGAVTQMVEKERVDSRTLFADTVAQVGAQYIGEYSNERTDAEIAEAERRAADPKGPSYGSRVVGNVFGRQGGLGHTLAHAALGAVVARLKDQDVWAGAIGAGVSAFADPYLKSFADYASIDLASDQGAKLINNMGQLLGAGVAQALGHDAGVAAGAAQNAIANNFLPTVLKNERDRLRDMVGTLSPAQRQRLEQLEAWDADSNRLLINYYQDSDGMSVDDRRALAGHVDLFMRNEAGSSFVLADDPLPTVSERRQMLGEYKGQLNYLYGRDGGLFQRAQFSLRDKELLNAGRTWLRGEIGLQDLLSNLGAEAIGGARQNGDMVTAKAMSAALNSYVSANLGGADPYSPWSQYYRMSMNAGLVGVGDDPLYLMPLAGRAGVGVSRGVSILGVRGGRFSEGLAAMQASRQSILRMLRGGAANRGGTTYRLADGVDEGFSYTPRAGSRQAVLPDAFDPQATLPRVRFSAETIDAMGPAPAGMKNAHRHHVLEVNGRAGEHRTLVREGQDILRSYKIDPLQGPENLVWAPNKGHTVGAARSLVDELRAAQQYGLSRNQVVQILQKHGNQAARR
jgi:LysM repeat protein